jgi:hypothetical protein
LHKQESDEPSSVNSVLDELCRDSRLGRQARAKAGRFDRHFWQTKKRRRQFFRVRSLRKTRT